ncbi:hypothetical protein INT47_009441, partial [Mucor saturninus]
MPFGLKVPSKNKLIFSRVAGGIAGLEMPRKVTVYITAPPGDGLEKSRTWFREYVKPILVAGAVDYEIKEAKSPGQIETSVMEEIVHRCREAAEASFTLPVDNMNNKKKSEVAYDGILAIDRNANREVLSALGK